MEPLDEIEKGFVTAHKEIKEWCRAKEAQQEEAVQSHKMRFKEIIDSTCDLQRDLDALVKEETDLKQALLQEEEHIASIRQEIEQLKEKKETLPSHLSDLERKRVEAEVVMQRKGEELQMALSEKEKQKGHLQKAIEWSSSRLGLRFERHADAELKVTFTHISRVEPGKEFWYTLGVDEADSYRLGRCGPPLGKTEVAEALEELNACNDFGRFVRTMRKLFKAREG